MMRNRREFLKGAVCAGGAAAMLGQTGCTTFSGLTAQRRKSMVGFRAEPLEKVRVGVIGVGHRGPGAVGRLSRIPGVEVRAISDLFEDRVAKQNKYLTDKGLTAPEAYFG